MPRFSGSQMHMASGKVASFEVVYHFKPVGAVYEAPITIEGKQVDRQLGVVTWPSALLFPRKKIEAGIREAIELSDYSKVLEANAGRA